MRWLPLFTLAAFVGLSADPAWAGFIYQFEQANYTVTPGGTVAARVYLEETATTQLFDEGLFSGAVKVSWDNAPVPSDPARVVQDTDIVVNPGLNDVFFNVTDRTATSAALYGQVFDIPGDLLSPAGPSPFRILLGTFTFTAGLVNGEVTSLMATDFDLDPDFHETLTGQGYALDGSIGAGAATITVSTPSAAVPEPGGLLLALLGGVSLCAYARLRRRGRG